MEFIKNIKAGKNRIFCVLILALIIFLTFTKVYSNDLEGVFTEIKILMNPSMVLSVQLWWLWVLQL